MLTPSADTIGALLALYWHGFHVSFATVLTVVAWPFFVALHIVVGLFNALLMTLAFFAALVIGGVVYWETTQRRLYRRMGFRERKGETVYTGNRR